MAFFAAAVAGWLHGCLVLHRLWPTPKHNKKQGNSKTGQIQKFSVMSIERC
jgi:hypothetical protein